MTDQPFGEDSLLEWKQDDMLEVSLPDAESFGKVRETLTRIGISKRGENVLIQSCHILHKRGKYYLVHFKEMFGLDGKHVQWTERDLARRNIIAFMLQEWGLLSIVDPAKAEPKGHFGMVKIIPFREKANWVLQSKYKIGG
jgi:hypothetical protein